MRRIALAALAALLCVSPAVVAADEPIADPVQVESPLTCVSEGGTSLTFPPRWVHVSPEFWGDLEQDFVDLQNDKTRLTAENESMRKSLKATRSRWYWIAGGVALGFAAGVSYERVKSWIE